MFCVRAPSLSHVSTNAELNMLSMQLPDPIASPSETPLDAAWNARVQTLDPAERLPERQALPSLGVRERKACVREVSTIYTSLLKVRL